MGRISTIAQIIKAVMSLAQTLNLVGYTSMQEKSYHCVTNSLKWAIHNHPPHSNRQLHSPGCCQQHHPTKTH
eukprot:CCRYP_018183-RA/>CCRYP_018183-RA protein AED:0.42 eAED:1.00 QI:0/-1/0/1/-1/0/1/0/71